MWNQLFFTRDREALEDAAIKYQQAGELGRRVIAPLPWKVADAFQGVGYCYHRLQDFHNAAKWYLISAQEYKKLPNVVSAYGAGPMHT